MNFEKNGFVCLSNKLAECKISLFGGNVVSYRPKNQENDVFWLGNLNKFDDIQAIRGGVPVCWPRFAEEKLNENFPRHGFARLSMWNLDNVKVDEEKISAELSLVPNVKYGIEVEAKLYVKITDKLEICLETINNSDKEFTFSEALHTYFNVGDRDRIKIKGLTGYKYKSSLDNQTYELADDLQIKKEFDAAFLEHIDNIEIVDDVFNRVIKIEKHGSKTTVVWNPDKDLAEMSEGQYKNFVCVEPANQGDLFVTLPAKEKHVMSMSIDVHKLK